ncbi:Exocyst complex component 5 [Gonapodya sp. JEL0774]|nr:Exocyst complex component 5 [Gonapodya sp. JEL0774]
MASAAAARGLNDQETSFIKQEALEKAREIKVKADEEFNIEKAKLVRQETLNIEAFYEKKQKQAEIQKRITQSTHVNKSRLRVLQTRQALLNQLMEEAKQNLFKLSADQTKYQKLLKDLTLQGLYQLMEKDIIIQVRKKDVALLEAVLPAAKKEFEAALKIPSNAVIDKTNFLPDTSAGGVVLYALGDRVKCSNTLESRLEILGETALPDMRTMLFGGWANFAETVFSEEAFVEGISERLVEDSRKQNQEFNPKGFIRTFESAAEEVTKLRKSMLRRIADLEDTAAAADASRRKRLGELNVVFEEVYSAFDGLETRIAEIGNTAVRVGEQLEVINKQKSKASEAREVILYFLEMQQGDTRRLEALRQSGQDGEYRVAVISRRLSAIAKEVDAPGTEKVAVCCMQFKGTLWRLIIVNSQTRANIERYCEELEKRMLDSFDKAYRSGDVKGMAYSAKTLYDFNGGSSCVQAYVNQHEFFIDRNLEEGLVKLFTDIEDTIKREWEVMCIVFPNAAAVMQQFIGRIYAQSVQTYVENMLENAGKESKQAYLRGLSTAHSMSRGLAKKLKFDDVGSNRRSGGVALNATSIVNTLERCHEDLFIPYTEGDRYLQRELKYLTELYERELSTFMAYHTLRKQQGRQHVLLTTLRDVQSAASSQLLSLSIPGLSASSAKDSTEPVKQTADELLSLESSLQITAAHAEAIARCVELTKLTDTPRHVLALFKSLIDGVGRRYVEGAIDMVLEDLNLTDSKTEPAVRHLTAVKIANQIMQLLQLHSQQFIVPFVNPAPTLHREMVLYKNGFFGDVEEKINKLLAKQTDGG